MGKRPSSGSNKLLPLIWQSHCHRNSSVRLEILRHHLSMVLPFSDVLFSFKPGIALSESFVIPATDSVVEDFRG